MGNCNTPSYSTKSKDAQISHFSMYILRNKKIKLINKIFIYIKGI